MGNFGAQTVGSHTGTGVNNGTAQGHALISFSAGNVPSNARPVSQSQANAVYINPFNGEKFYYYVPSSSSSSSSSTSYAQGHAAATQSNPNPTVTQSPAPTGYNQLPGWIAAQLQSGAIAAWSNPNTGQTFYAPHTINNSSAIWVSGPTGAGPITETVGGQQASNQSFVTKAFAANVTSISAIVNVSYSQQVALSTQYNYLYVYTYPSSKITTSIDSYKAGSQSLDGGKIEETIYKLTPSVSSVSITNVDPYFEYEVYQSENSNPIVPITNKYKHTSIPINKGYNYTVYIANYVPVNITTMFELKPVSFYNYFNHWKQLPYNTNLYVPNQGTLTQFNPNVNASSPTLTYYALPPQTPYLNVSNLPSPQYYFVQEGFWNNNNNFITNMSTLSNYGSVMPCLTSGLTIECLTPATNVNVQKVLHSPPYMNYTPKNDCSSTQFGGGQTNGKCTVDNTFGFSPFVYVINPPVPFSDAMLDYFSTNKIKITATSPETVNLNYGVIVPIYQSYNVNDTYQGLLGGFTHTGPSPINKFGAKSFSSLQDYLNRLKNDIYTAFLTPSEFVAANLTEEVVNTTAFPIPINLISKGASMYGTYSYVCSYPTVGCYVDQDDLSNVYSYISGYNDTVYDGSGDSVLMCRELKLNPCILGFYQIPTASSVDGYAIYLNTYRSS